MTMILKFIAATQHKKNMITNIFTMTQHLSDAKLN